MYLLFRYFYGLLHLLCIKKGYGRAYSCKGLYHYFLSFVEEKLLVDDDSAYGLRNSILMFLSELYILDDRKLLTLFK